MIDLRSDLLGTRSLDVATALYEGALRAPELNYGEDPDERALTERLQEELGVEAAILLPTCTMANQIAIRLHLPNGGWLGSGHLAHIVTVEDRATSLLSEVTRHSVPTDNGHPSPASVEGFISSIPNGIPALVWLENTHMLSAGSVMPIGWQSEIGAICRKANVAVHLDGSRLWNAAVAQDMPMSALVAGSDTVSISLNKGVGAPYGSVLAGPRDLIAEAVHWRDALGGQWRPVGSIAAAANAALVGWRDRLEGHMVVTQALAAAIGRRLGSDVVLPTPTNLIFLSRVKGDAVQFVERLALAGVKALVLTPGAVRLAIHDGVGMAVVESIAAAIQSADCESESLLQ